MPRTTKIVNERVSEGVPVYGERLKSTGIGNSSVGCLCARGTASVQCARTVRTLRDHQNDIVKRLFSVSESR